VTPGNAALERILLAPNDLAMHAEIRSQLDAAGIDRVREGQGPLPAAVLGDPALDRCGQPTPTQRKAVAAYRSAVCVCDPYRSRVEIRRQDDGGAVVSCPTCLASFVMPPLVKGGQGRDGGQIIAGMMTLGIIYVGVVVVIVAAILLRGVL